MKSTLYSLFLVSLAMQIMADEHFSEWNPISVPMSWESAEMGEVDGFAWYRSYIRVPEEWAGSRLLLVAGGVDDVDEGYFNGHPIGANGSMPPLYNDPASRVRRPFVIDPAWIRYGQYNLIAWRVYDKGGQGGIEVGPVHLTRVDDALDLAGTWLFRFGDAPAFSRWLHDPDTSEADLEVEEYLKRVGETPAGHLGVVPADIQGREQTIQAVRDRYKDNQNIHALTEGKGEPLSPEPALRALRPSSGLTIDTVLTEPLVRQPIYVEFDARGRMWITQYIQYPDPAGLKVLTWDDHLRKIFDVEPPPPPYRRPEDQKFIGKDKITIHEDVDGDGVYELHKTFVDGLNLATSTAQGKGGVWVMNPPYLLFYPDANGDDIPDGDPEVHLSGFGLEDTHSIANSLKWGPDGWLYGATGSTVTARVRVEKSGSDERYFFYGQNIWRYHPDHYQFELFAEGGWNTFGVDFDSAGRVYSGTNGNLQAVYFVQGGYYQKGFGKHGPHTNPHAFGHFYGLPIVGENVRLVHQWVLYEAGRIPSLEGHFVGGNSLANKVHALRIEAEGSRFRTFEIEPPIVTDDKWFRPVHAAVGPDGGIYISDWYDARITHVDPRDNWDRDRGRIYRLRANESGPIPAFDLTTKSNLELVEYLRDRNPWFRQTAQRLLSERNAVEVARRLEGMLQEESGQTALESLWALFRLGVWNEESQQAALEHPYPYVRAWGIRLLGDSKESLSDAVFRKLSILVREELHPEVVSQVASTLQRLPSQQAIPLLWTAAQRDEWQSDPYIPQQLWWALEAQMSSDLPAVLDSLAQKDWWAHAIPSQVLLERIGRRLLSDPTQDNLVAAARLIELAPSVSSLNQLIGGMDKALQGTSLKGVPEEMETVLQRIWDSRGQDGALIGFALRLGSSGALNVARKFISQNSNPLEKRIDLVRTLTEVGHPEVVQVCLDLLSGENEALKLTALNGLRRFSEEGIARQLLTALPGWNGDLRETALSVLAGRGQWSRLLLNAIESGSIPREWVPFNVVWLMKSRGDEWALPRIQRIWGELRQPPEETQRRIQTVRAVLDSKERGNPDQGRVLFQSLCGVCHTLFGEGRQVGPDLTGYDRGNRQFLIDAIVDPNLGVREEYELITITLRKEANEAEGAVLTGFVTELTDSSVTLKDLVGNITVIARQDIAGQTHSPVSIMPEGLLEALQPGQIRDLFAYLQSNPAGKPSP